MKNTVIRFGNLTWFSTPRTRAGLLSHLASSCSMNFMVYSSIWLFLPVSVSYTDQATCSTKRLICAADYSNNKTTRTLKPQLQLVELLLVAHGSSDLVGLVELELVVLGQAVRVLNLVQLAGVGGQVLRLRELQGLREGGQNYVADLHEPIRSVVAQAQRKFR